MISKVCSPYSKQDHSTTTADFVLAASNNTIASSTRLFNIYGNEFLKAQNFDQPSLFTVTESILNSMLVNVSLSTIPKYNLWPVTTNVTMETLGMIYPFSRPINILLPYFLTLGLVLPLLLIGLWALRQNGVPATDGGTLQVSMTTRGSEALDKESRQGFLAGERNIPSSLKGMEIMFGEFVRSGDQEAERKYSLREHSLEQKSLNEEPCRR
jgi:hypothetical protein